MRFALLKKFGPIGTWTLTLRDPPKAVQVELSDEGRPLVVAEVGRQDLFTKTVQVSDDEGEAVLAPRDDGLVLGHLAVAIHQIIKFRGERAARALLLGHRAGVAFWSVCCSVLRVWGRAQSVPARRAQFFAAVLRSLRQSCHKLVVAIGARYRRALAPAFG